MNVSFGQYSIQVKSTEDKSVIYDIVRKKWVVLTPEEQVRQLWIHYLVIDKKISMSKIAVERGLHINGKIKRFDICVYNAKSLPSILIECKSPSIQLSEPNLEQLFLYNLELKVSKFIVTNGLSHIGLELIGTQIEHMQEITLP